MMMMMTAMILMMMMMIINNSNIHNNYYYGFHTILTFINVLQLQSCVSVGTHLARLRCATHQLGLVRIHLSNVGTSTGIWMTWEFEAIFMVKMGVGLNHGVPFFGGVPENFGEILLFLWAWETIERCICLGSTFLRNSGIEGDVAEVPDLRFGGFPSHGSSPVTDCSSSIWIGISMKKNNPKKWCTSMLILIASLFPMKLVLFLRGWGKNVELLNFQPPPSNIKLGNKSAITLQ